MKLSIEERKARRAAYHKMCYSFPEWKEKKLAHTRAYRASLVGKAKTAAYEDKRKKDPKRNAYIKAYMKDYRVRKKKEIKAYRARKRQQLKLQRQSG